MGEAYSIRESLQGKLQDFVRGSGFNCIQLEELIRELVGLLAAYREEDLALFPEVYVFANQGSLRALPSTGDRTLVGTARLGPDAASVILKNCAPLAAQGWSVFAAKHSENELQYGLFRSLRHSLSTGSDEAMLDLGSDFPIILIRNRGHLLVELRNTIDVRFTASLRTSVPKSSTLEDDIDRFVQSVAARVETNEQFAGYLRRLLIEIVQHCHGTLMGVIQSDESLPESLSDGVWPVPAIDLAKLYSMAVRTRDADSLADLRSAEALLAGMVGSDGIVVFGNDGKVVAYRVFIKPTSAEVTRLPTSGGGRKRTYELMRIRMPELFRATLFRSQDGETACHRSEQ